MKADPKTLRAILEPLDKIQRSRRPITEAEFRPVFLELRRYCTSIGDHASLEVIGPFAQREWIERIDRPM